MKRILLLAADETTEVVSKPGQSQLEKFGNSEVVNTFLYGNCGGNLVCPDPQEVSHPGVLNQFDFFLRDLQGQSATFGNSIDPSNQLKTFVKSITAPPSAPSSDEDE